MNIFLHEIKAYRKSIITWSLSMAALALMYILIFNALGKDIAQFQTFIGNLPEVLRKALSIYAEGISNLVGFFSVVYVYIVLCGAIQAMNIGTAIVSKEVRDKTADFLMTKPVSRKKVLTAKLLAAFTCIFMTNIVYMAITVLSTFTVKSDFNMKIFIMVNATIFFVQLIFLALGVIVSILAGKIKSVISVSLSIVFGFFIVSMLGSIIGDKAVRYLSPFKYFDTVYIIKNAAYEPSYIIVGTLFIIAAIIVSFMVYMKKDIHAV